MPTCKTISTSCLVVMTFSGAVSGEASKDLSGTSGKVCSTKVLLHGTPGSLPDITSLLVAGGLPGLLSAIFVLVAKDRLVIVDVAISVPGGKLPSCSQVSLLMSYTEGHRHGRSCQGHKIHSQKRMQRSPAEITKHELIATYRDCSVAMI